MRSVSPKTFLVFFCGVSILAFLVVALRAYYVPITHDEASTFFFYIQTDNYLPYKAHAYTNNHVLNSFLGAQCYKLWGPSPFVLRLPNVLSFLVLVYGISRFFRHYSTVGARLLLVTGFMLTFNLLDFFALCRGYGISLSFMVAGLSFLMDYFQAKRTRHLALFFIAWQIALAANMALIQPVVILTVLVVVFQLRNKVLFRPLSLLLHLVNVLLLVKWIRFALYYRRLGLFDSGGSDGFYSITIEPLIDLVYGSHHWMLQLILISLFVLSLILVIREMVSSRSFWSVLFNAPGLYLFVFLLLIAAFMLQNLLLHVNFPDNRTVLFFYMLFVLGTTFAIDRYFPRISWQAAAAVTVASALAFVFSMNLRSFTHPFYHVMPDSFLSYLVNEQKEKGEIVTVGGNLNREMNYAFGNYLSGGPLNLMAVNREMHLNTDYCYALAEESVLYAPFYREVFRDDWNRVLLKRKQPLTRTLLISSDSARGHAGSEPFYGGLEFDRDRLRGARDLEVEVDITIRQAPRPWNAFLVFEVVNMDKTVQYKRIVLNWLADDLNGQTRRCRLTSSRLPTEFDTCRVYLWNIEKKQIDVVFNRITVSRLTGDGVGVTMPPSFYRYATKEL